MRLARSVRLSVAAAACVGLLSLAACGEDSKPEPRSVESAATDAAPESEDAAPESEDAAPAAAAGQPDWALPLTTEGESIATIEVGDVSIEAFQVGTATATKDGNFADPDTNKPILAEGDEIVFVNYVITNNGDPIDLGAALVMVSARYDDWKWMQGMDSISDSALFEEQGLNSGGLAPGAYRDPSVYTLGTGQQYSFAQNFKYQKGSPITFEAVVVPVDAEGELRHDERAEGSATGTIA